MSVLIPAFKAAHLGQAIASVLAQGHEDFELIVSDDSGGEELWPVVDRFRDRRVRYVRTAGRIGGLPNMLGLWDLANRELVQYLFDDDVLMPHALGTFVDELKATPDASFVFGTRQLINGDGRITKPTHPLRAERGRLAHGAVARSALTRIYNPIGEFSNFMINRRAGVTSADFGTYEGFELRVVTDVAFFLNATLRAPCAGVNVLAGSFRRHDNQNSSPRYNPWFAVGMSEWELFIRGEHRRGALAAENTLAAADLLRRVYLDWAPTVPLLAEMVPSLDELRERVEAGDRDVLDDAFRDRWEAFVRKVSAEKARRDAVPIAQEAPR